MVNSRNTYKEKVSQLISWGHWFSFFNIIAAMLIGTRYIMDSEWPQTLLGQLYLVSSWVGHFGFLVFGLYILILFPASFLIPSQRLMRLFSVTVATVGLIVLILDSYAYKTLDLHLSPLVWDLLLSGEKSELNARWQYLFVLVPVIFLAELLIAEYLWRKQRSFSRKKVGGTIAWFFGACFLFSHLIYIWADANVYYPVTMQRSNFPLAYPMTAKTFMEKHGLLDPSTYAKRKAEQGLVDSQHIRYPLQPLIFANEGTKQNILMIMVDSLRSSAVNKETMPYLNTFAQNNLNFTNHYSSSNNNVDSLFGLFYGLPNQYLDSVRAEKLKPVLLSTLAKRHYNLGLFSGDQFHSPLYYQVILGEQPQPSTTKLTEKSAPNDNKAIHDWHQWLNKQTDKTPWFGYIELNGVKDFEEDSDYVPHFTPSLGSSASDNVTTNPTLLLRNSYRNAAYHIDGQLAKIINQLKSKDLLKNTIIIITANHGMELNDNSNNNWGSNSNYSQYQLKVPMIIHWPEHKAQVISQLTSHLDLVPTLMKFVLHSTSPINDYSSGYSLFANNKDRPWVLAGNHHDIVIIQKNRTTVVDKYGNYRVYNQQYQLNQNAKPQLSTLINVMHELKRFYQPNSGY